MPNLTPRILIVEDSLFFRALFSKMLQKLWPDMLVDENVDGCNVVEWVNSCPPDIIFMDIHLPMANGLELTKEIKTVHPSIPVVVVTGHDFLEYSETAKSAGADFFLKKDELNASTLKAIFDGLVFV